MMFTVASAWSSFTRIGAVALASTLQQLCRNRRMSACKSDGADFAKVRSHFSASAKFGQDCHQPAIACSAARSVCWGCLPAA